MCIREPRDPLRRDMLVGLMERAKLAVNRGYAHLVFALHHCNLVAVDLLLAKGVDVNTTSGTITPLMRAVESRQIPATIVKKLINAGTHINAKDSFGRTAMDYLQGAEVEELADGSHNLLSPGDKDFEKKMKLLAKANFHRFRRRQTEAKET